MSSFPFDDLATWRSIVYYRTYLVEVFLDWVLVQCESEVCQKCDGKNSDWPSRRPEKPLGWPLSHTLHSHYEFYLLQNMITKPFVLEAVFNSTS